MSDQTWSDLGIEVPPGAHGGNVKVQCPNCSGARRKSRDKCLSINLDEGTYLCHHCEWSGVLKKDRPLPIRNGVRVPAPPVTPIAPVFSRLGERGLSWFANRGIPEAVVQAFGIYSERHYFPGAEGELNALCFPYRVNGELVNIKYRAAAEKQFTMVKGARKTFFNLDGARGEAIIPIVEGEMDVLACAAAEVKAISVPNGANSLTDEVMDSLRTLVDRADVRFILAVDADEPGQKLEAELARRIGVERCGRVVWPDGCKDANDVLMHHGPERLRALIETARPYPIEGIISVAEKEESLWGLYTEGLQRGLTTGWAAMHGLYSVRPGEFTVVTGEPGSGKSAWTDHLAVNMARLHDWRIGVYSPENQPVQRHIAMLAAKYVGAPFADGPTPRMSHEQVDAAVRWLDERFAFILPEEPTVDAVLALARVLVYRMGIRGLIIDPWNELDHTRAGNLSETEHISQCLTRIRRFARANGVHVWVVAHPTKLVKGANGKYPVATPYDIAGSAHWYNKADNAISVYRDKEEPGNPTGVHVQKIRFGEVGRIGSAELRYDVPTGRFLDLPDERTFPAWRGGAVHER